MGLDVTAYKNLKKETLVVSEDDDAGYELGWFRAYVNPDFPERAEDVEDRAWYSYEECCDGISRSYGGYSVWRNQLAELAGWPIDSHETDSGRRSHAASAWKATGGPFWELIFFADNEGVIGARISAKLAKDFADYQQKADAHPDEWFRSGYADMRRAFELAACNGCVDFH